MAKKLPGKCILTFGELLTQTKYVGKVSGVNMINGAIHLINDVGSVGETPSHVALSIVASKFGYNITKIETNPTMRASTSEATASAEDIIEEP